MSKRLRVSMDVISGIYEIVNMVNGHRYIGSSNDIYERWVRHKRDLKKEKHHNLHLQRAWKLYEEKSFEFHIIEVTSNESQILFEREQYWYDVYKDKGIVLYNASSIVLTPSYTTTLDDLKNGKRKTSYEQFLQICDLLQNTTMPFYQIAETTNTFVNQVYSIYTKEYFSDLTQDMNFKIRLNKGENHCNAKLSEKDVLEIIQKLINGVYTIDLARDYSVSPNAIDDIRNHRSWCYLTQDICFPHPKKCGSVGKPILQYDLNGTLIAEYSSAREAERITGIGHKLISRVCNGDRPYTYGFVFKFKTQQND